MLVKNMSKRSNKRGVSPVVATVLLIAIVIVIITIIFLWGRSVIQENVQKQGKPAEQACSEMNLRVSCNDGVLSITNLGNLPLYSVDVKINSEEIGLDDPGITGCPEDYEVIPVILGTAESAKKAYRCSSNTFRE